jgi:hypothetical protein
MMSFRKIGLSMPWVEAMVFLGLVLGSAQG